MVQSTELKKEFGIFIFMLEQNSTKSLNLMTSLKLLDLLLMKKENLKNKWGVFWLAVCKTVVIKLTSGRREVQFLRPSP